MLRSPKVPDATGIYLINSGVSSLAATLVFTVNLVYQAQNAHLSPLQLVLVGTVWEATYFIFEVPTGVVADVFSRRLSVIIGTFIGGAGLILAGALPLFETILLGHVVMGIGGTFVSGANEAWLADEVGPEAAGKVYLRSSQVAQAAGLIGVPISVGLALIVINLPMVLGGGLNFVLGAFLILTMKEHGFRPAPREERGSWTAMTATLVGGGRLVRRRPVLITILVIAAAWGMASEGFDRLYTPLFLREVGFPAVGLSAVAWFGIISMITRVLSIFVTGRVRARLDTTDHSRLAAALLAADSLRTAGVVAFALSGSFGLALATYLAARIAVNLHVPLYTAWINLSIDSSVRATVLSISSQADALGQVGGGPVVGLIGNAVSLRAALFAAGIALAPALLLYGRASRQGGRAGVTEVKVATE